MTQRIPEQQGAHSGRRSQSEAAIYQNVTTAFELPGQRIVHNYGIVRGIIVRSRSIAGDIGATFQQLKGGNITLYTRLCEDARRDAYELMIQHAAEIGANAVIGVRYDASALSIGVNETLCYGTAVSTVPLE